MWSCTPHNTCLVEGVLKSAAVLSKPCSTIVGDLSISDTAISRLIFTPKPSEHQGKLTKRLGLTSRGRLLFILCVGQSPCVSDRKRDDLGFGLLFWETVRGRLREVASTNLVQRLCGSCAGMHLFDIVIRVREKSAGRPRNPSCR